MSQPAARPVATIKDVARAAGVSVSTVSYVLTGKRSISPETTARVRQTMTELDYRPHAGARALANARTNVLGLVVPLRPEQYIPVVMEFVAAVATQARVHDRDVLLVTDAEGIDGLERVAASALVDGLIVMDVTEEDPRVVALRRLRQPSVLIGLPRNPAGLSCVDLDFEAAGRLAVDELADLGHVTIGLLGPPRAVIERRTSYATRLHRGVRSAAESRAVKVISHACDPTFAGLQSWVETTLADAPEVTALIVHNEPLLGFLPAILAERGLSVPRDMSVVALCPDDLAVQHSVSYSNIRLPAEELGRAAVEMVVRQLAGATTTETRLLSPSLTKRRSTSPREG
jgi:DNA-binding LacI/PurR family transcriptional regulator